MNDAPDAPAADPSGAPGWLERISDRRMAWFIVLGALILYVPLAGAYGLWDPWETHYGEVARQMTRRGDFISLWWPGSPRDQDVFWSKPVLTFWLISIAMHIARIGLPGGSPSEMAIGHRAEWALRIPMVLMSVMAIFGVYWVVSRFVSRRAGVLSAIVLATCPMFSLIARQAMTDMPFIGPMTLALCLGAMALFDDADDVLPRRTWRRFNWPDHWLFYLTVGVFALVVLPQLAIDSVQLRVRWPWGNKNILMYGAVAMIPYYVGSIVFVFFAARTRYRAPLYLYLAAMLCGLAVLAKGMAGLGFPVIIFIAYLCFTWNWRRLQRAQILPAIAVSLLVCVLVAAPWHHCMIIRHGWAFWDELFGDNHWRRMVMGRHGDRGSFEYFLRELGYGVWPWLAVAPAALVMLVPHVFARRYAPGGDVATGTPPVDAAAIRRRDIYWLGAIWLAVGYGVVSMSMTKFHHYVAPAIPGLAILIGCFLDRVAFKAKGMGTGARTTVLALLAGLPLTLLVCGDLTRSKHAAERFLWLFNYDYVHSPNGRPWPEQLDFTTPILVFGVLFSVLAAALAWRRISTWAVGGLAILSIVFTYFLLDVYMVQVTPYWTQKDPIAAYYQARRGPEEKLVAYMMYWRGETFYTKNEIYEGPREDRTVFDMDNADQDLQAWLGRNRGKRVFFMFERGRQSRLVSLLPAETRSSFTVIHDMNNKFSVARADM